MWQQGEKISQNNLTGRQLIKGLWAQGTWAERPQTWIPPKLWCVTNIVRSWWQPIHCPIKPRMRFRIWPRKTQSTGSSSNAVWKISSHFSIHRKGRSRWGTGLRIWPCRCKAFRGVRYLASNYSSEVATQLQTRTLPKKKWTGFSKIICKW